MDQKAWHFLLLDDLAKLLQRPFRRGMVRNIEMHHLPCCGASNSGDNYLIGCFMAADNRFSTTSRVSPFTLTR